MRAIAMTTNGTPSVLQPQDVISPKIKGSQDILIRLRAAGINPIDTKLRHRGTFYPEQIPAILGCDGAGVVQEAGSGVTRFQVGDAVYFCHGGLGKKGTGNYAEYAVVDEQLAAAKPASLSFAEAAAAPLVLITAWEALYDRGRLEAGRRGLVHAGSGGVGHVAIQLAKLKGAEVCTTVSSSEKAEFVKNLGAHPINYKEIDFVDAVNDWTNEEGVELAFDTVGGETLEKTFPAVQLYGDVVTLLNPSDRTNWKQARSRNLRIGLELMLTPQLTHNWDAQLAQTKILEQCSRLIDQGGLNIYLNRTFPLEKAAEAHKTLEAGGMTGKLALVMD
ncbi:MAG: alcohol dehydrogenase [Cyanobacteria bacterium SW_9_44_58]|nr:MAG: alcohol dehydrogenase [Cyanobacteria bacterium SW_9_44_58]